MIKLVMRRTFMKVKYTRNLFVVLVFVLLYVFHPYIHSIWSERTVEKLSAIYKAHQKFAEQNLAVNQSFQPVAWNDVHITVRTTKANHLTRYALLRKTWMKYAQENVHVITDTEDDAMQQELGARMVVVNCGKDRRWTHQSCKWGREFDTFIESDKKWWCHVDDDVYVNQQALLQLLNSFNPDHLIYLGRQVRLDGIKSLHWLAWCLHYFVLFPQFEQEVIRSAHRR